MAPGRSKAEGSSVAAADRPAVSRESLITALVPLVPFPPDAAIRMVDLGSADGQLSDAILAGFHRATLVALEMSDEMRRQTAARTTRFGDRIRVRAFDPAALDWWDVMRGADLVVSCLALNTLNDAKTQYLYKAAAERMSKRSGLLIADAIQTAQPDTSHVSGLLHHLVWLKHAGFGIVDCFWRQGNDAVYGGFKWSADEVARSSLDRLA